MSDLGLQSLLGSIRSRMQSSVTLSITDMIDAVRRQIRGDGNHECDEDAQSLQDPSRCSSGDSAIDASPKHNKGVHQSDDGLQLMGLLGEGAFGKVYRGIWKGEPVAVKTMVLPNNISGLEKRERMAIMEAAISTALAHPNIVQVGRQQFRDQLPLVLNGSSLLLPHLSLCLCLHLCRHSTTASDLLRKGARSPRPAIRPWP